MLIESPSKAWIKPRNKKEVEFRFEFQLMEENPMKKENHVIN